jgi:hypothetical protein
LDDDPVSVQVGAEENNVVLVLGMASKAVEVKVVEGQGRVVQARLLAAGNDLGHLHHGLHAGHDAGAGVRVFTTGAALDWVMATGSGRDHLLLLLLDQHGLPDPRHRGRAGPGQAGDLPDTGTAGQSLLDPPDLSRGIGGRPMRVPFALALWSPEHSIPDYGPFEL